MPVGEQHRSRGVEGGERERGGRGILSFRWNSSPTDVPLSESNRFYRDTEDWNIVKSRSIARREVSNSTILLCAQVYYGRSLG